MARSFGRGWWPTGEDAVDALRGEPLPLIAGRQGPGHRPSRSVPKVDRLEHEEVPEIDRLAQLAPETGDVALRIGQSGFDRLD